MVDERATNTGSSETWNELLLPLLSAPLAPVAHPQGQPAQNQPSLQPPRHVQLAVQRATRLGLVATGLQEDAFSRASTAAAAAT